MRAERGIATDGNVSAASAADTYATAVLQYGQRMSEPPVQSRRMAIALIIITGAAFVGVVVGLALGQAIIAGVGGLVLVIVWFAIMGFRKRR